MLDSIPQEVVEQIAFFAATQALLGPPSPILPLLTINRKVYDCLSITSNPHFYARIFAFKFDLAAARRRLGSIYLTPTVLADELRRRCIYLKRIRARKDSASNSSNDDIQQHKTLKAILWMAYLMLLENDGKNEQQLRDYAQMEDWLREYWFGDRGASFTKLALSVDRWPTNDDRTSLALWLFWFLLRPDSYARNDGAFWSMTGILKILALGGNQYQLTAPPWMQFYPGQRETHLTSVDHYSQSLHLDPPVLAIPAILSFFAFANDISGITTDGVGSITPHLPSSSLTDSPGSKEWDCEWNKAVSLGKAQYAQTFANALRPGSVEGVWEGIFTYTEMTAYRALLNGGPPSVVMRSIVVQHRQTWKLREHHLLSPSDSSVEIPEPLSGGDPLRSYFPTGTHIEEHPTGVEVREPGRPDPLHYRRCSIVCDEADRPQVQDIIITGEGHSAWGQFNLVGRVRPCDGFVSLSKEYVGGDRGKWLYRGYLVGDINGNLAGRWRDTLTPAEVPGYEGCFSMSRRR